MMAFIKLIRIPNLIIIAVLQTFLYLGILIPVFDAYGIISPFGKVYFIIFIIATILTAAAGYVINDIFDEKADKINKAERCIIGCKISERNALYFYFVLNISAFVIAFATAIHVENIFFVFVYVVIMGILYLYSKYFKKQLLTGNLIVSLLSAFVPGIILLFEMKGLNILREIDYDLYRFVLDIFLGFMVFSFFVSMYRELVKDIEDIEGDIRINAKTFPIVYGVEMAKALSGFIAIIILILLFYWMKMDINIEKSYMKIYVLLFVVLPLFYSVYLLRVAKAKYDFHKLSGVIKIIMVTGISILFFYI